MSSPLARFKVVELSTRGSAAYASRLLDQLGAETVRVTSADQDGSTTTLSPAAAAFLHSGKPAPLRLSTPGDLVDAVRGADIFLLDLELDDYEKWGLSAESLRGLGAKVVVAITPYGLTGPYARYRGSELSTMAFGGVMAGIGAPDRSPLRIPFMQSAQQGGLAAAITAVGALFSPLRAGADALVLDISESDVWATVHAGTSMISFVFAQRMRGRGGRRALGLPFPHGLFQCKDGWISIQSGRRFRYEAFMKMVEREDWLTSRPYGSRLDMQNEHYDEIAEELSPWFMERTRAEVFAECASRDIPAAPVRSMDEVLADGSLETRGMFETVEWDGRPLRLPAVPIRFTSGKAVNAAESTRES